MIKNKLKIIILALFFMSTVSAAQTISAWGDTLSDAESDIAKQAEKAGATYKITSARVGWVTYVTATLTEQKNTSDAALTENEKNSSNPVLTHLPKQTKHIPTN